MTLQDLLAALYADGYLSQDDTRLDLPADNQLGSAPITALLGDPVLFPLKQLVIAIDHFVTTNTAITMSGTIAAATTVVRVFSDTTVTATFTVDAQGVAQLAVAVDLPSGAVLARAFPSLVTDPVNAAGAQVFSTAVLDVASATAGPTMAFSGVPVPDPAIAGLWSKTPGSLAGPITGWSAPDTVPPTFQLATGWQAATVQAGLLPLRIAYTLASNATTGGSGAVAGEIDVDGLGTGTIPLSLGLPLATPFSPTFQTSAYSASVTDLSQLAPLFLGQQLANLVPSRFPIGNVFALTAVRIGLTANGSAAAYTSITVSARTTIPLLPLNLADLTGIAVTFWLDLPSQFSVVFLGTFELNGKPNLGCTTTFALPGGTIQAYNAATFDVSELIGIIPGLPALPQSGLTVETLSLTLSPYDMTYRFDGAIQASKAWSITLVPGVTTIALQNLYLSVDQTSSTSSVAIAADVEFLGLPLRVSAMTTSSSGGWIFNGSLNAESVNLTEIVNALLPFDCQALPKISLLALSCTFNSSQSTYAVQARVQWVMDILPVTITGDFSLQSHRASANGPVTYSGAVIGELDINNLILKVSYVFSPTTTDISFSYRQLTITYHKDATDPYVAISLDNSTVGDLFIFLLSFAEPGKAISLSSPWDLLQKIGLPNLTVKVHLNTKVIEVDIAMSTNLGFIDIENFKLVYTRQYGAAKFSLQLTGNFLGQDYGKNGANPLTWDPLNEAPPVVPGSGTQIFDLEYLGLGQHMTLRGEMPKTMEGVITALEKAMVPAGNPTQNPATQLPGLTYDAGSSWLIGTRFTAMSTVDLSVIFNDPNLYGLLIKLSGAKAGIFAGLKFEILYRKIADNLGVFHIELTLPDAMRHLEFGEVSITLPVITIDIYTNGNFRIDAGFPPSLTDFSRSFSVQVFPFIGYGGFYFALLDGQTSTSVPKITNGSFSPVLELGFALQVGVGKTISIGILSGGISITVGGMLQGVLAWFNPAQQNLPSERFFRITGTVAVVGIVYATVDFGIIQASVSLTVYASVTLDAQSYKSVLIAISAGVTVKVSIKILFVRISFHFSATITESFTIGSNQATPWIVDNTGQSPTVGSNQFRASRPAALLRHPPYARMRARPARSLARRGPLLHRQSRFGAAARLTTATTTVAVTAVPLISQALATDFGFPGGPAANGTDGPVMALLTGIETSSDPSFGANVLMSFLLEWVVDALGHAHPSVSAALLSEVEDALKQPGVADAVFSYQALQTVFTSNGIVFEITPRPTGPDSSEIPAAILPIPPEIEMSVPGYAIQFWADRRPVGNYEAQIQAYFASLAAQFAARDASALKAAAPEEDTLAVFVFRYYFLMLCQNLVQTATTLLGDYDLTLSKAEVGAATPTSVVNRFNNDYTVRAGDTLDGIAALFGLTASALAAANPQYAVAAPSPGETVFIPATAVTYTTIAGDSLAGLSTCFGLGTAEIEQANPTIDFGALQPGTKLAIPGTRVLHDVLQGETATSIAQAYGIPVAALEAANPAVSFQTLPVGTVLLIPLALTVTGLVVANQGDATILQTGTALSLGDIGLTAQSTDSLSGLAGRFGVSLLDLMTVNAESQTLLAAGQAIPLGALATTTRDGDSFQGLLAYWYGQATPIDPEAFDKANPGLVLVSGQKLSIPVPGEANADYVTQPGDTVAKIATTYAAATLTSLLDNNPRIALTAGQAVVLPAVSPETSASYLFTYTARQGDTLTSIARTYFAADPATQTAAVQSLQQWNGGLDADKALAAGTWITVPYFSSLANLTRQYGVPLATLAALPGDIWSQTTLLAPRAALTIADVRHTIADGDSFGSIASNYDLSIDQLAARIALTTGLFDAEGVTLEVKAIPGMNFEALVDAMATSGSFTDALNMTSRFMLNGLRLPAPQFAGEPAPSPDTAYPLYALIGQEFPVAVPLAPNYGFTLALNGDPAWLSLPGGTLVMPLDADEIARIEAFATLALDNGITSVQPTPIYAYSPDRQPPSSLIAWDTPEVPAGLTPAQQKLSKTTIWSIPNALNDALAASATGTLPYQAAIGTTQADGSVTYATLSATRWTTIIDIDVEIPPNAAEGTYVVLGADQAGTARLLALWSHVQSSGTTPTIYLAYPDQSSVDAKGTVVSDALNRAETFLIKTNLSTESHGAETVSATGRRLAVRNTTLAEAPIATLEPADGLGFLQMLWELSVVKTGGYYLNYALQDGQLGLPGTLFSVGQQATIQVVVVLEDQAAGDPLARSFNNGLLVGEAVDASTYSLAFQAVTHTITAGDTLASIAAAYGYLGLDAGDLCSINQTILGTMIPGAQAAGQTVLPADTFGALALRAGLTPGALGQQIGNQTGLLQPGALLQLAGSPVRIVAAGDTLASIAAIYDFLDPQSLAALNENATPLLAVGATMTIPGQPAYTIRTNDTFASIARAHSVDLSTLAQDNADAAILAAGTTIAVDDDLLVLGANLPPGNIGFTVARNDPQATDPTAETPQQALGTLFNLLGFQLATTPAYGESNEGLPAGPTTPADAPVGTPWSYQQVFSLVAFAEHNDAIDCLGLPPPASNPYAGIGKGASATIELALQDVLGNRTLNSVLPPLQQAVGYTDPVSSPSSWPSATLSYRFAAADTGNLHVAMTVAAGQFLPDDAALDMPTGVPSPKDPTAAAKRAGKAALQYQTASYQLQQSDVTCCITTSLGALSDPAAVGLAARQALLGVANAAYVFLTGASTLYPEIVTLGPGTGFADLAALTDPQTGFDVPLASLGKINAFARADLLWGQGAALTVPYDYVTGSGDTAQAIATRSRIPITVAQLADQNSAVPLAGGVLVATADRVYTVPTTSSPSLSAIAQQVGGQVPDGPGGVPGLATSNAKVPLTTGLTLGYGSASFTVAEGQTLTDAAAAFSTATGAPVTVIETAVANQYLDGLFPAAAKLTVASVITVDTLDTLASLTQDFGPPPGQSGTPAEQMLLGNAEVPGLWPIGTALFVADETIAIALGDTLSSLALANGTTAGAILADNKGLAFVADAALAIPFVADVGGLATALYAIQQSDTLGSIANKFPGWSVTALGARDAAVPGLFNGTPISLNGRTVTPTPASTIASVAAALGLDVAAFSTAAADLQGILAPRAAVVTPPPATDGTATWAAVAAKYGFDTGTLAAACATLPALLPSSGQIEVDGTTVDIRPNDTFALLTARINASRSGTPVSVAEVGDAAANLTTKPRTLFAPPLALAIDATVTAAYAPAILDLGVMLTLSRDPDCVAPGFLNAPGVVSNRTAVPAQPFAATATTDTRSLQSFAADFEAAFPGLKLATGPDRIQGASALDAPSLKAATATGGGSTGAGGKTLWVVNFSETGTGFTYDVQSSLRYFAIPPLTTKAWDGNRIAVPSYDSSSGLTWPANQTRDFRSADPDQWNQSFLAAVDLMLSPAYAVPAATDAVTAASVAQIIAAKANIAAGQAGTVQPIVAGDDDGLGDAIEAMKQQLLVTLSSAYSVQTLVQTDLTVKGGGASGDPANQPNLSGKIVVGTLTTPADIDQPQGWVDPAHPFAPLAAMAGVSAVYLAEVIADMPSILRPNLTATANGKSATTLTSDTIATLAGKLGTTVAALAETMTLAAGDPPLFLGATAINVTAFRVPKSLGTVTLAAGWMDTDIPGLLLANTDRTSFFAPGSTVTLGTVAYTPTATDTLAAIAARFGGMDAFARAIGAVDAGSEAGSYQLNPDDPPHGLQVVPQLGFTTAKAPLSSTASKLTSLLSVKDPSIQKSAILSLAYQVNQVEFDIHSVAGIQGYKSSSWLSFIIPIADAASTNGDIGTVQVPIPLRGYPNPALISGQSATPPETSDDPTKTLAQWNYDFTVDRQFAAQDELTLSILFNQNSTDSNAAADTPKTIAVIQALAAFSVVWPAISADLSRVPDIQGGTAGPTERKAIAALAELTRLVEAAWVQTRQLAVRKILPQRTYDYRMSLLSQGAPPYFTAVILERQGQTVDFETPPDDFLFQYQATAADIATLNAGTVPAGLVALFAANGFGLGTDRNLILKTPGSPAANTDWLLFDENGEQSFDGVSVVAPQTYRLLQQNTDKAPYAVQVWRQLLWPGLQYAGTWLGGLQMGTRLSFDLPDETAYLASPLSLSFDYFRLNALLLQDAWGSSYVSRNANLLQGQTINPAFVYKTPPAMFPTQITPLIVRSTPEPMSSQGGQTLAEALSTFFETLLAAQTAVLPGSKRAMRIGVSYWQSADGTSDPTKTPLAYRNPLVLLPVYAFDVSTDWQLTDGSFCETLAATIQANAVAMGIVATAPAEWVMDVLVYTYADPDQSQPAAAQALLNLQNLTHPV